MFTEEWVVELEYTSESIYYDEPDEVSIVECSNWLRIGEKYTLEEAKTKYASDEYDCKVLRVYKKS